MKIKTLLLTILLGVLCAVVWPRQAEARVTFSYFYESLAPYGDWVDVERYGYCWQPRGVAADWRPYTDGYWSYTDAGWTWVSYEDFGSITYHYGRWVRLEDTGWVWRPDFEWGPAWVSWRQSDDYVGWAPLPPEATFDPDSGIGVWADRDYDIGPSAYVFCEPRYFGAPVLRNYVLPWHRNLAIINSTVNITNITVIAGGGRDRVVFNGGLDFRRISSRGDYPIEMLHLQRQREGDWSRHPRPEFARRVGDQLIIAGPEIEAPKVRFAPASVARSIQAPRVDKGWSGIADPRERDRVRTRYSEQTQGLTRATAPAKQVEAAQVQTMMREVQSQPQRAVAPQAQGVSPRNATGATQITDSVQGAAQEQGKHFQRNGQQAVDQAQKAAATAVSTPQEQGQRLQRNGQQAVDRAQKAAATAVSTPQEQGQRLQRNGQQAVDQAQKAAATAVSTPQEQGQRLQRDAQQQADQQRKAAATAVSAQQEQGQRVQREAQQQAAQQRNAATEAARTQQEQGKRLQREVQQQAEPQRRAVEPAVQRAPQEQAQRPQREAREAAAPRAAEPSRERSVPQAQPQAQRQSPQSAPPDDKKKKNKDQQD